MIQWLFIFTQNPHFTGQIESQNVWTPYKMGRMEYDFPEMWAVNQNVIQYSLRSIISCTPSNTYYGSEGISIPTVPSLVIC